MKALAGKEIYIFCLLVGKLCITEDDIPTVCHDASLKQIFNHFHLISYMFHLAFQ